MYTDNSGEILPNWGLKRMDQDKVTSVTCASAGAVDSPTS